MVADDNIGDAFLSIFQTLTMEGWSDLLYNHMDGYNAWGARFFHSSWVLIGTFFVIQLALAVLSDSFVSAQRDEITEKEREALSANAILKPGSASDPLLCTHGMSAVLTSRIALHTSPEVDVRHRATRRLAGGVEEPEEYDPPMVLHIRLAMSGTDTECVCTRRKAPPTPGAGVCDRGRAESVQVRPTLCLPMLLCGHTQR